MRLRIVRSFESRAVAASSKPIQVVPAIYQFYKRHGASQVQFGSDILNGFRGIPVFEAGDPSANTSQDTQSAGNQGSGKVIFILSFSEPSAGPLRTNA